MGNKVEGCTIVMAKQSFREQAVNKLVRSGMDDVEGRRLGQSRAKKSVEVLYYLRVPPGDEVVKCSVFTGLELTVKNMKV